MEHVAPMLLDDPRLNFASDLIAHWTEIRGSGLVPFDIKIDPTKMIRSVPFITIAKIADPEISQIQLIELGLHRRYGRDITRANWFELLPPQYRASVKEVTRLLLSVPCGLYYRLRVSSDDQTISEGETLALPLRSTSSESPDIVVSLTGDISFRRLADPAVSGRRQAIPLFRCFVDIGAGIPDQLPFSIEVA